MKHIVRWGLVALIFVVALVFFGSVICPPIDERDAETVDSAVQYPLQEDPGTYRALPGDLQIEDRFPLVDAPPPPPLPADSFSTIEVTVLDERGRAVQGARVHFLSKLKSGYAMRAGGLTDALGKFTSPALFRERYEVRVNHDDYFTSYAEPIRLPSEAQSRLEIRMSAASYISGLIHTASGRGVVHGQILFTDLNSGDVVKGEIRELGAFRSPPLDTGNWSLSWSATPGATPEPNMRFALPIAPKEEREFRIVIPDSDPNLVVVYDVGISDYLN